MIRRDKLETIRGGFLSKSPRCSRIARRAKQLVQRGTTEAKNTYEASVICDLEFRCNNRLCPLHDYFILAYGTFFSPKAMPSCFQRRTSRQCYYNACNLMLADDSLYYCEGFATSDSKDLIEHGWCIRKDGIVIDVTWRRPGLVYFGIAFGRQFAQARFAQMKEHHEPLISESLINGTLPRGWRFIPARTRLPGPGRVSASDE